MSHLRRLLPVLLTVFFVFAGSASAQLEEPLGGMWLSFDGNTVVQTLDVKPGDAFVFFIQAEVDFSEPGRNEIDGILAWEAQVLLPAGITVNNRTILRDPINCLDDSCGNDFSLGYSSCIKAVETPVTLVRYDATVDTISDVLEISLTGASASSTGGTPGWLNCTGPQGLRQFATGWSTPLQLQLKVSARDRSWSSMKAAFN